MGILHAAVVWVAFGQAGDLLSHPIRNDDSAVHFHAAVHVGEHLRKAGTMWGYDPGWMAGYPNGALGLVDNKLYCLLVWLAPPDWEAAVYNAGFLLALLSPPWLLYLAARTGAGLRADATGAALAAVAATFAVPLTVGFLAWGGISFFLSSVLSVPAGLLLAQAVAKGSLRTLRGAGSLLLASFTMFVHPATVPVLGAALLPAFVFALARGRRGGLVFDALLIGMAVGLPFLPLVEGFVELREPLRSHFPGGVFMRGGLGQVVEDFWTLLFHIDWLPHGAGGLVGILLLAALGWSDRRGAERTDDERIAYWTIVSAGGACVFLAYVASSVFPRAADLQPYRFILPLSFLLCLPAGRAIVRISGGDGWRRILSIAAVAIVLQSGLLLSPVVVFGVGSDPAEDRLVELLERQGDGGGRTLVESHFQPFPASPGASREIWFKRFAFLPLRTRGEFLGYTSTGMITAQRYASFGGGELFGRPLGSLVESELEDLLRRYAVTRVVACRSRTLRVLHRFPDLLEQREEVGGCWTFDVRRPHPSRLLEGRAEVRAALDRIEVREAEGDRLVLKYHWLPSLRVEPPLPIEEARQAGAPVGFIAVRPGSHRNFEIVQRRSRSLPELLVAAARLLVE